MTKYFASDENFPTDYSSFKNDTLILCAAILHLLFFGTPRQILQYFFIRVRFNLRFGGVTFKPRDIYPSFYWCNNEIDSFRNQLHL